VAIVALFKKDIVNSHWQMLLMWEVTFKQMSHLNLLPLQLNVR